MKKFTSVFLAMVLTATVPAGFQAVYAEDTSAEDTPVSYTHLDVYKRQVVNFEIF